MASGASSDYICRLDKFALTVLVMSKRARIDASSTPKVVWSVATVNCATILSFLSGKAIVRNSRVCKQWRVAAKMRNAWDVPDRGIIYHFGERDEWARVLEFCAPYVPKVHRLLVNVEPDAWSLKFERDLSLHKLFTPELKELRFYDAHKQYRVAYNCPLDGVQHCTNLQVLTVSLRALHEWSHLIGGLTNLKHLTVAGGDMTERLHVNPLVKLAYLEPMFANLESLTVCADVNYTAGLVVNEASGKAPKLKSLSVISRKAAVNDAPNWVEDADFPALTGLHLDGMLLQLDIYKTNRLEILSLHRIRDTICVNNLVRNTDGARVRKIALTGCNFRLDLVRYIGKLPQLDLCELGECRYNSDDLREVVPDLSKFCYECHGTRMCVFLCMCMCYR